MNSNFIAVLVYIFFTIYGFASIRSGLKKEDKSLWLIPTWDFKTPNYILNLIIGAIAIVLGLTGLILYLFSNVLA